MAKRKLKAANINATIYNGQFDLSFECVGEDLCALATFFCEPHEDGDECSKRHPMCGGNCTCPHAAMSALKELRGKIDERLNELEGERQ